MQEPTLTDYSEFTPFNNELQPNFAEDPKRDRKRIFSIVLLFVAVCSGACFYAWQYLVSTPNDFPVNTPIEIELGTSTKAAAHILKEAGAIRSEYALLAVLRLNHKEDSVKASTYTFDTPLSLHELAAALTKGDNTSNLLRITHKEGETVAELATIADEILVDFDESAFLALATNEEGKLFPETYFVPKNYTALDLFTLMRSTFDTKIEPLSAEIQNHSLTLDEIIILASILEREANSLDSKRIVSGILQTRLDIGMALQVDASMEYVLKKPLSELTAEDLDMDSPYNTYLYPDLPPTPIGNPGLEAIKAVLNPEPSDYLFYITGDDGNFYYARDFEEHKINIARHLR